MRPLRFIPPGSLVEVTMRTIQGRLLLRPNAETNEIVLGILGLAQQRYAMTIHYVVVLSNHVHLLVSPRDSLQLARFMCFLNANIAREIGRLVHWHDRFWADRYHAIVVSDEAEAQMSRLRYLLSQGVKEDLVNRPEEWPGISSAGVLMTGCQHLAGTYLDRAGLYRAGLRRRTKDQAVDPKQFETVYRVEIEPLPCLVNLDVDARRRFVNDLVDEITTHAATDRKNRGIRVLGALAVKNQPPHSIPNVSYSPAPLFHAATSEIRRQMREAYRFFVEAFRDAAAALRKGLVDVAFPEGSFPPALPFVPHPPA
jgi:REP element-mobilizing transposase RayT